MTWPKNEIGIRNSRGSAIENTAHAAFMKLLFNLN